MAESIKPGCIPWNRREEWTERTVVLGISHQRINKSGGAAVASKTAYEVVKYTIGLKGEAAEERERERENSPPYTGSPYSEHLEGFLLLLASKWQRLLELSNNNQNSPLADFMMTRKICLWRTQAILYIAYNSSSLLRGRYPIYTNTRCANDRNIAAEYFQP